MIHQPFSIDQIQDLDYIAIVGPTGVGKSGYAIQLAQQYPNRFEIISVDSVQVYRGLDIGSAKVDSATRKDIKHHLIDSYGKPEQCLILVILSSSQAFKTLPFFKSDDEASAWNAFIPRI